MPDAKTTAWFNCLRCGHEYEDGYSPAEIKERACPKCHSNSVRRVMRSPAAAGAAGGKADD